MRARLHEGALTTSTATADTADKPSDEVISKAIGEELRRTREVRGWSRAQVVDLMPSGIGDRTLLSYEQGTRHVSALRLVEIGHALETSAPTLLTRGLQRAQIYLETMPITVNVRALLQDANATFSPMLKWARNALKEHPDGIVEVEPAVVQHLALFIGCTYRDLANYLAWFLPDN